MFGSTNTQEEKNNTLYKTKKKLIKVINSVIKDYAKKYSKHTQSIDNYFVKNMPMKDTLEIKDKIKTAGEFINKVIGDSSEYDIKQFIKDVDMPFEIGTSYGILDLEMTDELLCVLYFEFTSMGRTRYSRELDRILVSKAFRHLQYKTQVMNTSASDDQRTRLLHSLEVQRIAKILAVQLKANWELAEAIAIGHDVGHAPFGHSGEEALNKCLELRFFGNFSHALQSVKVLNFLESHEIMVKYGMGGIGLSKSVLEGILRHDTDSFTTDLSKPGFKLQYNCPELLGNEFKMGGIEAQIVYWADKIAYLAHDWEEFALDEALDKISNRIYIQYLKMKKYIKSIKPIDEKAKEFKLINMICDKIEELNSLYSINNENSNMEEELKRIINELTELRKKLEIDENDLKIFSSTEYMNLFSYFEVALAWFGLTNKIPEKGDGNVDIIYILNNFFKTTGTRIIKSQVEHKLKSNTFENINKIKTKYKKKKKKFDVEAFKKESDKRYKKNKAKAKENIKTKKIKGGKIDLKDVLLKSLIVTLAPADLKHMQKIREFIQDKYIKSTNVINMSNKANKIIPVLFEYYLDNYQMLPYEYRNRYRCELLMHKRDDGENTYRKILKQNYNDRLKNIYGLDPDYYSTTNEYAAPLCDQLDVNKFNEVYMKKNKINKYQLIEYYKNFYDLLQKERKAYSHYDKNKDNVLTEKDIRDTLLGQSILARVVVDYIASMTDRMATKKYDEIVSSKVRWSTTYSE